jgi:hypothetical protein
MTCTDITTSLYIMFDHENFVIESPSATFSTTTIIYTLPRLTSYTLTVTWHPVNLTVTYNPCQPWLSVPERIYTLQSAWSSCVKNIKGLKDPPTWLTTASGFRPINGKRGEPITTNGGLAAPATPAASVSAQPTKTASPSVDTGSPLGKRASPLSQASQSPASGNASKPMSIHAPVLFGLYIFIAYVFHIDLL